MQRFNEKAYRAREHEPGEDLIRDRFVSDEARIVESKAFRRLAYKTQVFSSPGNVHVRSRLDHTNEVNANAIAIAEGLGLNTGLCRASALGHDIGHTPYGHLGERVLSEISGKNFKHPVFGVVIAQHIERKGKGLNLTYPTLLGILHHSRGAGEMTVNENLPLECTAVMYADKIAYTFADLNDAMRMGYLSEEPLEAHRLGNNQRERTYNVINALLIESRMNDTVIFQDSPEAKIFKDLRDRMYEEVYFRVDHSARKNNLYEIYNFFSSGFEEFSGCDPAILTALLTDQEAIQFAHKTQEARILTPGDFKDWSVFEIIPYIKTIDWAIPGLDQSEFKY